MFCFGTRPEVIKLAPLINKSKNQHIVKTVFTGQHQSLFEDVKDLIDTPDYCLNVPTSRSLNTLCSLIFSQLPTILEKERPDILIVQGDTSTVFASSVSAFHMKIPIGHVEAGYRTYDVLSPFPEEFNRQSVSKIASFNWCPTTRAAINLANEGITSNVWITGNTVIDFLVEHYSFPTTTSNNVIVTLHRRENFSLLPLLYNHINTLAEEHPYLNFIFTVHPNPSVSECLHLLSSPNIQKVPPFKYRDFLYILSKCKCILTDSGGIQEEAGFFKKKVLICRQNTERPEGIEAGFCKLMSQNLKQDFQWALQKITNDFINPYGDGTASEQIIKTLL
jgi:UDP-N-acetylglucosamine 2-epimerase (non-hydrolysing)